MFFTATVSLRSPRNTNKPSQTVKAKVFIIGTYSVRQPHCPTLPGPSCFSRRPQGLPISRFPHSPRRCSSQKHAGGGLPLAPPLTKWILQRKGGGERKTVLNFDVPPIKSLRGCGVGVWRGEGLRFAKIN